LFFFGKLRAKRTLTTKGEKMDTIKLTDKLFELNLADPDDLEFLIGQLNDYEDWASLCSILVTDGIISKEAMLVFLSTLLEIPNIDLADSIIDSLTKDLITPEIAKDFRITAVYYVENENDEERSLVLAMADPTDTKAIDHVKNQLDPGQKVLPHVALLHEIIAAIPSEKNKNQEESPSEDEEAEADQELIESAKETVEDNDLEELPGHQDDVTSGSQSTTTAHLDPDEEIDDIFRRTFNGHADEVRSADTEQSDAQDAVREADETADMPVIIDENPNDFNFSLDHLSVMQSVEIILNQAIKSCATEIHIIAIDNLLEVQFRINGRLRQVAQKSTYNIHEFLYHLRLVSGLYEEVLVKQTKKSLLGKIFPVKTGSGQETRILEKMPQSADFQFEGRIFQIKICRLANGYKMVLLHQPRQIALRRFINQPSHNEFLKKILNPYKAGLVITGGGAQSGKRTFLYRAAQSMSSWGVNIISVEFPVKQILPSIHQVQVDSEDEFAKAVRSSIEQKPNVLLIDSLEHVQILPALRQALDQGILVLSAVNAPNPMHAFRKLTRLGFDRSDLSQLRMLICLNLVRQFCEHCKKEPVETETPGINTATFKSVGCFRCNKTGFSGLTAVYDLLEINARLIKFILENPFASNQEIKDAAAQEGIRFFPLIQMLEQKLGSQQTSYDEIKHLL